jgi:hypothetical protein
MAEALTLRAPLLLQTGTEVLRRGRQCAQLLYAGSDVGRSLGGGLVGSAGGRELAPGALCVPPAAALVVSNEAVEHVEPVGGTAEAPLLELAGHGDELLARGSEVLARGAPAPGVGARAPVAEDPAGEDEAVLVLGPQLGKGLQLLVVEEALGQVYLRLDVGLLAARTDRRSIALCTQ